MANNPAMIMQKAPSNKAFAAKAITAAIPKKAEISVSNIDHIQSLWVYKDYGKWVEAFFNKKIYHLFF